MCNLVIKLEVSYQVNLQVTWPWARAQQPQVHQEAAGSTDDDVNVAQHPQQHPIGHEPAVSSAHMYPGAAADMHVTGQQQQDLAGTWRHHSAGLLGEPPFQQGLATDRSHQAAADDYYSPARSSLSPQLAQERLEASGQSHGSRGLRSNHLRGFAASGISQQAPFPFLPSSSQWGRAVGEAEGHTGTSLAGDYHSAQSLPMPYTQDAEHHLRRVPATSEPYQESRPCRAHAESRIQQAAAVEEQWHVVQEEQGPLPAAARQPQHRRLLQGSWSPAGLMRRMVGNTRRNRGNDALGRASSASSVCRMSARTDLADASAMPAAN